MSHKVLIRNIINYLKVHIVVHELVYKYTYII